MADTFSSKILLNGLPIAWVHKIDAGAITLLWKFDNLQSSTFKMLQSGSDTGGGENLDINRGDGAIIRFPKTSLVLDGKDGADITPADSSSDATSKGEITIITNEAPMLATRWTAFLKDVRANKSALFLITVPTGISYDDKVGGQAADGYVHMIGKINNDIESQANNSPSSLTLTFVSYVGTGVEEATLTGLAIPAIPWKLAKATNPELAPASISAQDAADLIAGDIVIVPAA